MKLYTIDVCACGRIIEQDVDCPSYWRGSGVYDVEYEVYREFRHYVCATNKERALKLVARFWFNENTDWCNLDTVYYDPDSIKEEEDKEEGTVEEVYDTDYEYTEPKFEGRDPMPDCYSKELPALTLQEKINDALARYENDARSKVKFYKEKNENITAYYQAWITLIENLKRELRK